MQVTITGQVRDSAGIPESGHIEFSQAQRMDNGEYLITMSPAVAAVVGGELKSPDGSSFKLPSNPGGTAVRVLEMLGGETYEWWAAVPELDTVEYREIPVVQSESVPESVWGPPPWLERAEQMRDETVTAIEEGKEVADALGGLAGLEDLVDTATQASSSATAAASAASTDADRAEAAADSIDVSVLEGKIANVESALDTKADLEEGTVPTSQLPIGSVVEQGTIPVRGPSGELSGIGSPVSPEDAATKRYVDEASGASLPRNVEHVSYAHAVNPAWSTAVSRVLSGTEDAKVLCIGDSTTYGTAASMPEGWMNQNSWPSFVAQYLNDHVAPTSRGLVIPPSDGSSVPARTQDTRWTIGSGWDRYVNAGVGLGGKNSVYYAASPGAGYLDFRDPYIVADRFDVYYLTTTTSSFGTMRGVVGSGGTPVEVVCGGQAARDIKKMTLVAPTRAANQLVRFRNAGTSGSVFVLGVEPWDSTQKRIRVGNAASSGSTSVGWVEPSVSGADSWNIFQFLKTYKPHLTVIDLGINDAGPSTDLSVAGFIANVKRIADAAAAEGSGVLFKTMIPSGPTGGARWIRESQYVDALKTMSPQRAVLDLFNYYSYEENNARGWMSDSVHGNELLYRDAGDLISAFLGRAYR